MNRRRRVSFGYWTTDFLVVQRLLTARDLSAAKLLPIIGAGFRMLVPFIVILPGLPELGIVALIAGFMPGMAGNMSAFATV
ncbi:MAG: Na+/galactose cotransporter, partial [Terriglobales bacterium]